MLKKLATSLILSFALVLLTVKPTLAFQLQTIGTSQVYSSNITEWWYTSQNPTMTGTAAASSTVTISIDSVSQTATADASGNWTYHPTTLTAGDHQVSITGDGTTVTFTIHIGSSVPATVTSTGTSTSSATLPVTGSLTQTLLLLGGGALVVFLGIKAKAFQTA